MPNIHISTARKLLSSPEPVDLTIVTKNGEVQRYKRCIGLKWDRQSGCRNVKLLDSGEMRKIRDCLILEINGCEVFI